MGQVITLEIPEEAYQRLELVANAAHSDVSAVLLNVVEQVVHPLADSTVFSEIALLSDAALSESAGANFPPAKLREFDRLCRVQEDRPLTPEEQRQMDALRDAYQVAEMRKACALAILHLRQQLEG